MSIRQYSALRGADLPLVTTAETVVVTLEGVSMNKPGQSIVFNGSISVVTGTATTDVVLRVREDDLTGSVVHEAFDDGIYAAIGAGETRTVLTQHRPASEVAGKTYVLTAQQTAATGNGTVTQAAFVATVFPL